MKARCYNPKNPGYKNYGGRGINICDEWLNDPEAFISWALKNGYKPELWIDRVDISDNYSPENCRWLTPKGSGQYRRGLTTNWEMGTRVCSSCKVERQLDEFHKDRRKPGGHMYMCKGCRNEYERRRRKKSQKKISKIQEIKMSENVPNRKPRSPNASPAKVPEGSAPLPVSLVAEFSGTIGDRLGPMISSGR